MSAGHPVLDLALGAASVHKMPSTSTVGIDDEEEDDVVFDSPEEEIAHYREKYRQSLDMLTDTRAELEEFQQSSKELEDEMEQELAANEKQQADLRERIKKLEVQKEEWKNKHIALQKMHSSTTAAMQREMDNLRSERDKTLVALRDLEMGNDELERNERVAVSSLLDLESKYNRAIEEKTLLEQDLASKDEMEADSQRLKDELRDAYEEINHLKDQLARAMSTPPSSISTASPSQEPTRDLAKLDMDDEVSSTPLPPPVPSKNETPGSSPTGLRRSGTFSAIPVASPSAKRFSHMVHSPSVSSMNSLSRSTTSRNLAAAARTPHSPATALARSRSGIPQASPARVAVLASHQQTKSRGFKLLHDLQARLKATDDKLNVAKVPRRNVSNPVGGVFGVARRVTSASSNIGHKDKTAQPAPPAVAHTRERDSTINNNVTPRPLTHSTSAVSNLMSPGWVLVGDNEDTPTGPWSVTLPTSPDSPLDPTFRSTSTASSNRSLPSRPGIPSPLASGMTRSTISSQAKHVGQLRPASRLAQSTVTRDRSYLRPMSPSSILVSSSGSRPMSPSLIPTASRPLTEEMFPPRTTSPLPFSSFSASTTTNSHTSGAPGPRPSSRTSKRNPIGRGPPPVSSSRLHHHQSRSSLSGLPNATGSEKVERAKRAPRRSSVGGADKSGIPAPSSSGTRTPSGRPSTVHVFKETPPPVPRVPSSMLKNKEKGRKL